MASKIKKSKKVFDNSKVTDHHAIIPTGVRATAISENERKVYDLITRRFIAVFYPNCKVSTTTVLGEAAKVEFKVTGKQILDPGWRVVFEKQSANNSADDENNNKDEENILPDFIKGENGPHEPSLNEKWTTPPKYYTEATLLRAMETAGKLVDNEELRDALKENGIGRPSTRAAIIETLFKRNYIRKEKKNLFATITGVQLIQTIQEELLKSAELTGIWENKLRQIERSLYDTRVFIDELKQMLIQVVTNVRNDWSQKSIEIEEVKEPEKKPEKKSSPRKKKEDTGEKKAKASAKKTDKEVTCPLCKKGKLLKGKAAYGCSEWKAGCTYRLPFDGNVENMSNDELRKFLKT